MNADFDKHGVGLAHHFGGGVYAKEARIPAGVVLSQHAHPFAHLSVLASGRVLVEQDGASREASGPTCLTIPAHVQHRVTAITPAVWFCIHATDEVDPGLIDAAITKGG